jgi:hypothetical protein
VTSNPFLIRCLIAVTLAALVVPVAAPAAEPQAPAIELYKFFDTEVGKIAFLPGDQAGSYRVVLAERFWSLSPLGSQPSTPENLSGLAKDTRDWATQLVPADGRAAEAKRLAAGYRSVGERAAKGEFSSLIEVQQAQAIENRKALGIPLEDTQTGKASRWYPVILKWAEYLKSHPPADAKAMSPISADIAKGLEAVP